MAKKAAEYLTNKTEAVRRADEAIAFAVATYADDKKAEDIVIMNVEGISPVADYFVICTATSMPHLRAVRNEIKDRLWVEHQRHPIAVDEKAESLWFILHYGDVMVHIFHQEKREFYALEELWGDAPRVPWAPVRAPGMIDAPAKKKAAAKKTPAKKAAKKVASKKPAAKKAVAKKAAGKKAS